MTDTKDKKREKLGILCCTAGATSWGLSGTCSEALFSQYPVDTTWVTAVRMTSAGIILLFLAFAKHSLNLKELGKDKKGLIEIVLFAIAGLALCQYAYLSAIKWTNSGTATVIQNLSIVFIAVYVCLTTRTAPDKRTVFCIILALFGVWLLATGGKPGNMELTPRGLFWGLMAGIGAASYSLLSRAPVKHRGSIPVSRNGDVHRRDRSVPDRPELEDPGRAGRTGDALYGGDRPAWDCRCVYVIPPGDRSGRPRKSGTPVLSGTIDRGNLVRRLAALQLFSDGSDRVCVYSGNGGADEVEKNYGLFPDGRVFLLSRTVRIRTADSRNILHVLTVFPHLYFARFLLYNSYKKMLYCCVRKKISVRSSFLFSQRIFRTKKFYGGELHG